MRTEGQTLKGTTIYYLLVDGAANDWTAPRGVVQATKLVPLAWDEGTCLSRIRIDKGQSSSSFLHRSKGGELARFQQHFDNSSW